MAKDQCNYHITARKLSGTAVFDLWYSSKREVRRWLSDFIYPERVVGFVEDASGRVVATKGYGNRRWRWAKELPGLKP